jgi:uncharacterized membrane protein
MTTTEVRITESSPDYPIDRPAKRSRLWGWVAVVGTFVVFAGTLGYVTGNEVQANTQFDQTHRLLDTTRLRIAGVVHDLTVVRHDLDVVTGQVAVDSTTLANDTTKLDGARTALANAQTNVSQQTSATVNLDTCLGGVERALNALALGDPNRAVRALTAVAGSCISAVAAGG